MLLAGTAAALQYAQLGLALSHYDARAHLVVSRRILDSMVPGWQQIGAVWLPLPHLLNMLPVQIDALYRSGASAIAVSVLSMAVAAWALARLIVRTTGASAAALTGAALLLANPNLLYLQSTPMTEPLLFASLMVSVMLTAEWVDAGQPRPRPHAAGLALAAACMTRYEAWPVTAALIALAAAASMRNGLPVSATVKGCAWMSLFPAAAVLLFILNSRWTTGQWFVSTGFFVAENEARGQGWLAWEQVRRGAYRLSGSALVWSAYASAAVLLLGTVLARARASLSLLLALPFAAALPWYAYINGHPLRVRYSLPLVFAACALCAAGVALLPRRIRAVAGAVLLGAVLWHDSPFNQSAPMVREAQRDASNRLGRATVTRYLAAHHQRDDVIVMSMGSLSHYMHDLSAEGFRISDFLHEGNGELWPRLLERGPHGFARWVAVEEQAEGGDALFLRSKGDATFLRGFERVAQGGGVALYRVLGSSLNPGPRTPKT